MADPRPERILDNLVEAIEGIDGTGSYVTNVKTVEKWARPPAEISPHLFPWVGLEDAEIRETFELTGWSKCRWQIRILAFTTGSSENEAKHLAYALRDDIRRAVMTDYKRGTNAGEPNAIATKIVGSTRARYTDDKLAQIEVIIEVIFNEATSF